MDTVYREYDSIVSVLYRSAIDQDMWTAAIDQLVDYLRAEGGALVSDLTGSSGRFSIVSTHMLGSRAELRRLNVFLKTAYDELRGGLVGSVFSDTGMYQVIKIGNDYCCSALVLKYNSAESATLSKKKINCLRHHLSGAINTACKLRDISIRFSGLQEILDRSTVGICALDRDGSVIHKNSKAARIIESENSICINDSGHLCSNKNDLDRSMQKALSLVAAPSSISAQTVFVGAANSKHLVLEYSKLATHAERRHKSTGNICILVSFAEIDAEPLVDIHQLSEFCGLTKSEKAVAALFISGYTNYQVAAIRKVSVETIKSQSRAISEKTQTFSRVELMQFAMKFISFLS